MAYRILTPDIAVYEGCPTLAKTKVVVGDQGTLATVEWVIRDKDGNPVDLTPYFTDSDEYEIRVIWATCDRGKKSLPQSGSVTGISDGEVQFDVHSDIVPVAGIFLFNVAVVEKSTGNAILLDTGIYSNEASLFGDRNQANSPPTISEIRRRLRDYANENTLLQEVEYSDLDVVDSIILPVREWNETPPLLKRYRFTCASFPYHKLWTDGAIAELLMRSIHHYTRNNLNFSHGGISGGYLNKDDEYLKLYAAIKEEWVVGVGRLKRSLNIGQVGFGAGSPYGTDPTQTSV